jgi:hypothetical protein
VATELRILSWCDVCLDEGENVPGETLTVAAGIVPAFDVELCPRHAKPLAEAVAALAPLGRPVGKGVPKVPATRAPARRQDRTGEDNVNADACPECGRHYATRNALRGHLRTEHGQTLADAGLVPANFSCSVCGAKFAKANGLGVHLRTHGAGAEQAS